MILIYVKRFNIWSQIGKENLRTINILNKKIYIDVIL